MSKRPDLIGNKQAVTHGMRYARVYRIYRLMRQRCYLKTKSNYSLYGGRGIRVCAEWSTFEVFFRDMGEPPSANHSLDRIDTNGDYSKDNCRWATPKEQSRNKRNNRIVEIDGYKMTLVEASEKYNVSYVALKSRLGRGWDIERALKTPIPK